MTMRTGRQTVAWMTVATLAIAAPAFAQIGSLGKKLVQAKQTYDDMHFTDQEEHDLGEQISVKLRDKYGVVQDKAVTKYVALVGAVLAQSSSRPNLPWTFIVLDTDGINAFAAPGGYVHITRGALALIQNEAELADVLGHEISHVTEKHTIKAIQKSNAVKAVGAATRQDFLQNVADRGYSILLENGYDRNDEKDADKLGVELANKAGYAPTGLSAFLTRLNDRNKGLTEPSGLFASHPQTQDRLDTLTKIIASEKLSAPALVAARYTTSITYKPIPVNAVPQGGAASPAAPADKPGGSKFGLGGMNSLGKEKSSDQTISSAGSRGVNPDRDAKGGPIKTIVVVTVTAAEVDAFKKGISG
jgi:predicted Zn-dependent protease